MMVVTLEPEEVKRPRKDSSMAICIVQVYFLGQAAIARALTLTVNQQHSSQERPTKTPTTSLWVLTLGTKM